MEYANLNREELRRKLAEVDNNRAAIERALRASQKKQRSAIVQQIRDLIHDNGYSLDEIVALLTRRRRGSHASSSASASASASSSPSFSAPVVAPAAAPAQSESGQADKTRRYYVDLENPDYTYSRGVLPQWMKRKMLAQGLDPESKADRESFKSGNMRLVVES